MDHQIDIQKVSILRLLSEKKLKTLSDLITQANSGDISAIKDLYHEFSKKLGTDSIKGEVLVNMRGHMLTLCKMGAETGNADMALLGAHLIGTVIPNFRQDPKSLGLVRAFFEKAVELEHPHAQQELDKLPKVATPAPLTATQAKAAPAP